MVRPRKCRRVEAEPGAAYFKPRGTPMESLDEVRLKVEGLEALRLADLEGLCHQDAAERMEVSRQTFGRVLCEARRAVAQALVGGMALKVDGGNYAIAGQGRGSETETCPASDSVAAVREDVMSKIAISSEGPSLDDMVDPRFGRAGGFVLVDPDTNQTEYLDNGDSQVRAQGAGIQAAENVAKAGAKVVLTGFVGPKAFQALNAVGIQVGQNLNGLTVGQALERYNAGEVPMADAPNR